MTRCDTDMKTRATHAEMVPAITCPVLARGWADSSRRTATAISDKSHHSMIVVRLQAIVAREVPRASLQC